MKNALKTLNVENSAPVEKQIYILKQKTIFVVN